MKLFVMPHPWDYHECAKLYFWADSQEQALEKAKARKCLKYDCKDGCVAKFDKIEEVTQDFEDEGCDC